MRIRQREIRVLRKSAFFNASISFTWLCAPFTVIHSLTHSLTVHSFTHLFIHSLTHSLIHSFIHSFIHLFYIFQVAFVTFITYSIVNKDNPDQQLTAERAFVALSLFNILRFPFTVLPTLIPNLVQVSLHGLNCIKLFSVSLSLSPPSFLQVSVSVKRLSNYLKGEELDPRNTNRRTNAAVGMCVYVVAMVTIM